MANNSTRLSLLQPKIVADSSDALVAYSAVSNADVIIPVSNLYSNVGLTSNGVITSTLIVTHNTTPANSTANSIQGSIWSDGTYIYVTTATNSIKRVALTAF